MHEPLSQRLARILEADALAGKLTLNDLLLRTEGRGIYLVIILLNVPFITPLPLPGISTIAGAIIVVLAIRLALGLPPALPRFMGERTLPPGMQRKVLSGSVKFLTWVEKFAKPRRTQWLSWPSARVGHALVILFLAGLLALPIPPVIPFSNTMPALGIILMAMSMMEEDGLMIWISYGAVLVTVLYLGFSAGLIATVLTKLYHQLMESLRATS